MNYDTTQLGRPLASVGHSGGDLDAMREAVRDAVIVVDTRGRIIEWNPAATRLYGYRRDEILGAVLHEVLTPPRFRRNAEHGMRAFAEHGSGPLLHHTSQLYGLRKDGSEFPVELSLTPLWVHNAWYAVAVVREARQVRRCESELAELQSRYMQLLAAVTTYTYSVQIVGGAPVSTNHSLGCVAVTGYWPEDYRANAYLWIDMVHEDDRDTVRAYVDRILRGENALPIEHRLWHRDGRVRWVRNTALPHRTENGLEGYDGLIEDITEQTEVAARFERVKAEMLAAQEIQGHLLPSVAPELPGYELAGASHPATFTGGDYFDYFDMPDGCTGIVVGDVSGHGLGSAILMALAHAHFHSVTRMFYDPGVILDMVNRFLSDATDHFVTAIFASLDAGRRTLRYVNAGHPAAYVYDAAGRVRCAMESQSVPLAIDAHTSYPSSEPVQLETGDLVLLLTDGILEAASPDGTAFGVERVHAVIRDRRREPAPAVLQHLYDAVLAHTEADALADDLTGVVLKVL